MTRPTKARSDRRVQPDHVFVLPQAGLDGGETLEWYLLSPAERFAESQRLWRSFLQDGRVV
ncbi:MAG: hypothetical protein HYZ53_25280 [Planctomycetes bacterium]|nr:hypothetical protein [Planctomycetota bacterium]